MTLTKGTRVYYNGDIANPDGFGTITEEIPASRFITKDQGSESRDEKALVR